MNKHETIAKLMNDYGTSVLHLTYSYVRNRQTSEDLTQEIFIKCFEKLDSFKGNSSIQTWLYRIAVNHCKDYVKSWNYRKVYITDYISSFLRENQSGAEEQFLKRSEKNELIDAVFKLPIKYREIIFLYYFHECSQKEISEIYQLNINTVKSRLSKGKELLRKSLVERGVEYGEEIQRDEKSNA
ncbi:sigma-70 family RNA polymerase sigma factor [Cytobacillus sp. FJAT-54145]|uniref:Sigma-70 family RNA polymerase sigma factor n=1 Tax=Cytobacillus spartinae TaxID=3299023 RepID=A0ABW6KL26_9BACI